jgi:two-component system CheB/CheR fusion protein
LTAGPRGDPPAAPRRDQNPTLPPGRGGAPYDSDQRFRLLADSAPLLIWMSRPDGTIEFANREFAEHTGLSPDDLEGRPWSDLLHRDDVESVTGKLAAAAGPEGLGRVVATAQLRTRNGDYRWMKLCAIARTDEDGRPQGIVGSMTDVHAQIDALRALHAADRRKDEFLAMLGHELRNPLVPIRNAAEVLDRVAGDDSRLRWVRDTLVRQVEQVTRLVDDLLDISLVTRGAMRLDLAPVAMDRVIERAVEAATPLIQRKRHRFVCTLPDERLWVDGDAIRLAQVIENLLTNAAKYTDDGGDIAVSLRRSGDHAELCVCDNGLGIAPGMCDRIFDLFVQDERSVDRSQGGLGIGLALVRHLVELHHGTVDALSEGIGRGCEFVVRLPLLSEPLVEEAPPSARKGQGEATGGRILVVDDDADSAETTTMLLRFEGHEVEAASDLDGALQAAARLRPQVVLLDLALPHNDGYEVLRRLRQVPELPADAKFIAVSGFGRPEDFEQTARAGFERLMVKPVDPVELEQRLRSLLAR